MTVQLLTLRRARALAAFAALTSVVLMRPGAPPSLPSLSVPAAKPGKTASYGELPLAFVPNRGQTDPRVKFTAQAGGATFFFSKSEAALSFVGKRTGVVLHLRFLAGDPDVTIDGARTQNGKVNYLLGSDPANWRTALPTYGEVAYRDLWPGIDVAFRGERGRLKYEFRLAPGADPRKIRLAYRGAIGLSTGPTGELRIRTGLGVLRDAKPRSYQSFGGRRAPVATRYSVDGTSYGFAVGAYDRRRPLVIDPGLVYSTFLGGAGSFEGALGVAVGGDGSAYVTGRASSPEFPTTPGAFDTTYNGSFNDAFVTKLSPDGASLAYSTFIGGISQDGGFGTDIAVDATGNAYVTGDAFSGNFPTTPGAFDTTHNGGGTDVFLTKLNADGSALVYSTFIGGAGGDIARSVAVDGEGNAYVTGVTPSPGFPTTPGAFDTTYNGPNALNGDAFVTKVNATGSALVYSTFLGGSGNEGAFFRALRVALDGEGNAYVTGATSSADFPTTPGAFDTSHNGGFDAFVTKFDAAGSALVYSTYLGGASTDSGEGVAVDGAGNAYAVGWTDSPAFPTTAGASDTTLAGTDAYVTKLNSSGSALVFSTLLGGGSTDQGFDVAVDASGSAHISGETFSTDYPTTPGAVDTTYNGGGDTFVAKLNGADAALAYSTVLGGTARDEDVFSAGRSAIAVGGSVDVYVVGTTASSNFPTTTGAFDTTFNGGSDAFATKLTPVEVTLPAALDLSPSTASNPVETIHTVTATVTDSDGQPVEGIIVRFNVAGSVTASGSCTTNASGQCSFSYGGPAFPGADMISAHADSDGDAIKDAYAGEPTAEATKSWFLPASTPGQAAGGGTIEDAAGNKIAFGFSAKNENNGLQGHCNVVDPSADVMVQCDDVTAFTIDGNEATIYGNATVNGVGTTYVIKAKDAADPGRGADTFSIRTASGYSRSGTLTAGNVEVG